MKLQCLFVCLAGVALAAPRSSTLKWWQTGVLYQIYPRSFKDSDGDGVGDLRGIREKLNYLKDLGVTGVWLSPIYKSPMADAGYDIADFRDIDPVFGNMEDFDALLKDTHELGMKLIMDFVPNHSSDEHEWFVKASNPNDLEYEKYKGYYVWHDAKEDGSPPNNWRNVFGNGISGDAWTWNEKVGQYYLHQFHQKQPDLNYRNADLVQEMKNVLKFWMDKGVDGFRVDAIQRLVEDAEFKDNTPGTEDQVLDLPETYDMIEQWREVLDTYPDKFMMLEVYGGTKKTMEYFGTEERRGGDFPFNTFIIQSLNSDNLNAENLDKIIHQWIDNVPSFGWNNWLIGNHDNHRAASRLGTTSIDAMNMVVMLLPGTAITYDGEEIGMTDNMDITYEEGQDPQGCTAGQEHFKDKSRDFERSPMQWDDSDNAGFSNGSSPWLPVNKNYVTVNVEAELKDPLSHLSIYKKLVKSRNDPTIQTGDLKTAVLDTYVYSFSRRLDSNIYVVVLNIGDTKTTVDLTNELGIDASFLDVYVSNKESGLTEGQEIDVSSVEIGAHGAVVLVSALD
ncbi:maltase A1 [Anabrus simplex]|uniref:maltase A1 n=1 Tax=Anabrus simplex TaxID=316456 RepID=UPI0035A3C9BE